MSSGIQEGPRLHKPLSTEAPVMTLQEAQVFIINNTYCELYLGLPHPTHNTTR